MTTLDDKIALARDCLDFCAELSRKSGRVGASICPSP
jgi:hypothetical protein